VRIVDFPPPFPLKSCCVRVVACRSGTQVGPADARGTPWCSDPCHQRWPRSFREPARPRATIKTHVNFCYSMSCSKVGSLSLLQS
jgi:hypothetical protein